MFIQAFAALDRINQHAVIAKCNFTSCHYIVLAMDVVNLFLVGPTGAQLEFSVKVY